LQLASQFTGANHASYHRIVISSRMLFKCHWTAERSRFRF